MLKFLTFLWCGCWHKWEIVRTVDVVSNSDPRPIARDYELKCLHCGDVKKRRL